MLATVLGGLEAALRDQPLAAIPALFGAGLLTSLTPCIYPMIPITAGILAGAGAREEEDPGRGRGASRARTLLATLVYVVGLALVYAALGLVAGLTGTLFGTISSNPWAYFAMANLLLLFGLALLDVFPVRVPERLSAWAGRRVADGYGGIFVLGATSGLVAAPCGAPAFAAVLTFVSATQSAVLGFAYLFVFSLGMTALLVVVGLSAGTLARLPKAGRWTLWIKRVGGIVLLGMAEYYLVRMGQVT